ncbi:hypothetical protein H6P81_016398 [Aristolochia fimbriata]|uniref:Multiple inositol polyphosphate phosphatase 1 n=1 Tax=Aristolochia fimbriata TaxID=158543 RepID=A0AAV7E8B1_ARIFI|nr:hypothetical protein H6P81_016398 [Aristolochia fimbriata]
MKKSLCLLLLFASFILPFEAEPFDVLKHLSTVTRYDVARGVSNEALGSSSNSNGCTPLHLNLLARHGTRSPTKKRIKELDWLAIRLETLLNDAKADRKTIEQEVPDWLKGWRSPWEGKPKGGELISRGEEELYHLGVRIRERFPQLFNVEYHPDVFSIRATQVPRASASAVAFGMGLFSQRGSLGPGKNRAFSVISETRASDIWLRFYDTCKTYKEFRESREPDVDKLKKPFFYEIATALFTRYHLNFTSQDVSSLWFLCKQQASLLDITDQACSLFNPSEIALLEWTDDLEVFLLKGYGNSLNYHMGVPLLQDVIQSMEQAIVAKEENHASGTFEKARLRFAHAETVVPFTCLLGLFIEGSELDKIARDEPLNFPVKPPMERKWKGSVIAPFAGNTMLVLYQCPANNSESSKISRNKYFVQVLHNEVPVTLPGCGNVDFCPLDVFKEQTIGTHLKHDYEMLCSPKTDTLEPPSNPSKEQSS